MLKMLKTFYFFDILCALERYVRSCCVEGSLVDFVLCAGTRVYVRMYSSEYVRVCFAVFNWKKNPCGDAATRRLDPCHHPRSQQQKFRPCCDHEFYSCSRHLSCSPIGNGISTNNKIFLCRCSCHLSLRYFSKQSLAANSSLVTCSMVPGPPQFPPPPLLIEIVSFVSGVTI